MNATQPYIGAMMSLLSKSNFRYTGILASIDVKECTIGLARVRCYGTEGRSDAHEVPGSDKQHDHIIFKASDIKDLFVIGGSKITGGKATALAVPIDDPAIVSQRAEEFPSSAAVSTLSKIVVPKQLSVKPGSWCSRCFNMLDWRLDDQMCKFGAARICWKCRREGHPTAVCPFRDYPETAEGACSMCLMFGHQKKELAICGEEKAYERHIVALKSISGGLLPVLTKQWSLRNMETRLVFPPMLYYKCSACDKAFLKPDCHWGSAVSCVYCKSTRYCKHKPGMVTW